MPQLSDEDYKVAAAAARGRPSPPPAQPGARSRTRCSRATTPPDPRFAATAAELEKKGVKDFQLDYAIKTLKRLAPPPVPLAAKTRRAADAGTAAQTAAPARLKPARLLALAASRSALLGGALVSQYVGGLYPCEMCYWQRWPHGAAILLALGALLSPLDRAANPRC